MFRVGFHEGVRRSLLRVVAAVTLLVSAAVLSVEGMPPVCWMPGAVADHDCCDHTIPALQAPSRCSAMGDGVAEVATTPFQLVPLLAPALLTRVVEPVVPRVRSSSWIVRAEPRAPPRPHRVVFCSYLI